MQASRTGSEARPGDSSPVPIERDHGWVPSALALGAIAVVVLGFFLSVYVRQEVPVPLGWDTSKYLWQTHFVQAEGLDALSEPLPPPYKPSLSRPAFPIIAATISSVTGVSTFRVAAVLPSVMAVVIAVAAGAFVTSTLRRPLWELTAVALAVGTSAYAVRLAAPEAYQDNLTAAAILLAACVPIVLSVAGVRRLLVPAIALLAIAAVTHWSFFMFFAGVLGLSGVGLLPGSWRRWRSGTPLFKTPAGRLGIILGAGGILGAGTIYGLLGAGGEQPKFSRPEFRKKLRQDIPKYRFPLALPLAAVGAGSLLSRRSRPGPDEPRTEPRANGEPRSADGEPVRLDSTQEVAAARRYMAYLLTAWILVAAAGLAAFTAGLLLPAHRFLAFALAVPILGALGLLAIGRWIGGRTGGRITPRAVAGGVVVAAVIGLSAASSYAEWEKQPSWARMDRDKVTQAAVAASYLDRLRIPMNEPFVFIVDDRGPNPDAYVGLMTHMIRASMPADRLRSLNIFAGSPEDFLADRPSLDGSAQHDRVSERFLDSLEPILDARPVAFVAAALNDHAWGDWITAHPETRIGSDVALVQGPGPAQPIAVPQLAIGPLPAYQWILFGGGLIAVFGVVGLGWTLALLRPALRRFELLALAPSVGLAALVVSGVVADRAGIALEGVSGAAVPVVAAALGWVTWGLLRRRRRDEPTPA